MMVFFSFLSESEEICVRFVEFHWQPSAGIFHWCLKNRRTFIYSTQSFLLQYLHSLLQLQASQTGSSTEPGGQNERFEHVAMALEALRNIIKASPGS